MTTGEQKLKDLENKSKGKNYMDTLSDKIRSLNMDMISKRKLKET